jgi:hypothetical protein
MSGLPIVRTPNDTPTTNANTKAAKEKHRIAMRCPGDLGGVMVSFVMADGLYCDPGQMSPSMT